MALMQRLCWGVLPLRIEVGQRFGSICFFLALSLGKRLKPHELELMFKVIMFVLPVFPLTDHFIDSAFLIRRR